MVKLQKFLLLYRVVILAREYHNLIIWVRSKVEQEIVMDKFLNKIRVQRVGDLLYIQMGPSLRGNQWICYIPIDLW